MIKRVIPSQFLEWCAGLATRTDWCVLDTETTGLDTDSQACEIAVVNAQGDCMISSLIKPTIAIPDRAMAIHGITNSDVEHAPRFDQVWALIWPMIKGKELIIYNASYDIGIIGTSLMAADYPIQRFDLVRCAMKAYADWYCEPGYYGPRWQKLEYACHQQGVTPTQVHTALGDCLSTHALLMKLAKPGLHRQFQEPEEEAGNDE